jgi:hypothetical protein
MSRNKNVSRKPANLSSKLKLTLKKERADFTKFLKVFLFLEGHTVA